MPKIIFMKRSILSLFFVSLLSFLTGRAFAQTTTFTYSGAATTWTVPAGVANIAVTVIGAKGGTANTAGGNGDDVTGVLAVTPGKVLQLYVGGQGNTSGTGGFNGGGASGTSGGTGGGASDIRASVSDPYTGTDASHRYVVAGGGGGGAVHESGQCTLSGIQGLGGIGGGTTGGNG